MGGGGWLKMSEYRYVGEGSKIAQKTSFGILTFSYFLYLLWFMDQVRLLFFTD